MLLVHGNRLCGIAELDAQSATGCRDAEVLVPEATDQVEGFLRWLLLREAECVGLHLRLDGRADMRCRSEEPIGRHEALDALMGALKVVVLDKQGQSAQAVSEVGKHRLAQKLLPQRLPEPLDLAERLRMLRSALAVRDTVSAQLLLELRFATPRRVLPTLIGEHLARLSVLGDTPLERLHDQARLLVMGHRPRHQVARVVVHEADEVHALMASQLEGEDVALPELVWLGALEASHWLVTRRRRLLFDEQPLLVQDASHGGLRDAETLEAREDIANPPGAPLRVRLPDRDHLGTLYGLLLRLALAAGRARSRPAHA
jgi:hypothetical protein